ncbi:MAG: uroporphyrinogen-III decarboxylase [Actinobacteria bacterium RBG_16_64_13]|nr:MAG: uroporphyrinogen-III decarboxylase [Actinobacteria bacterium RBG_16_64_13]
MSTDTGKSPEQLYQERLQRLRTAVALGTPDRVPVLPNGPAWPARALGVKMSELATNAEVSGRTIIDAYTGLGEIDGIQSPAYHVSTLSIQWLSRVKVPGKDLPEDELWQVDEAELMIPDDYDAIVALGFGPWVERYYAERLPGSREAFNAWAATIPSVLRECRDRGIVPFSPAVGTIPYEYFCGGRSMKEFLLDLYRRADKVQAAMDAALPVLIESMRGVIRGLGLVGLWLGGWRSASEFIAPRLWERFVFPYFKGMVEAAVEEGAIPVLHFDANWDRDIERLRDLPKGKCVLSLDGKTDIFRAKKILGDHMCLMGDVPPRMFSLGTPGEVTEYCKRLISEVGPGGFILSSGCDVPIDAKYENVKAMVESVAG